VTLTNEALPTVSSVLRVPILLLAQSKVELESGGTYTGTIISDTADSVVLLLSDSVVIAIPKSSITNMEYSVPLRPANNYWSAGVVLGSLNLLQAVGSYDFEDYGIRLSLAMKDSLAFQLNLFTKLLRTDHFSHELSGLVGVASHNGEFLRFNTETRVKYFIGVAYAAHWYGFFAELGSVFGDHYYRYPGATPGVGWSLNPQLLLQLGYIYEFR
jgi:hypothetical protein